MRRPGIKGRTAVDRAIRVVADDERVKVTQAALMRAPSVEAEVNALRAEEEQAEATAAYVHHHLKPPDLSRPDRFDSFDGAPPLGGGAKTGTNFAAELLAARVRGDRSLSTPQAAGGGGQRPAFTGIYRPAKISRRDRWRCSIASSPTQNIQRSGRQAAG